MSERPDFPLLSPDEVWARTVATTASALASGALQPLTTDCATVEDGGVQFQVRVLGRLALEVQARREQERPGAPRNPFAEPEPALVVGAASPTHLCLLNKFNVVPHHLLLVTRAFEEQEAPLTPADFEALARCLAGVDGLAFYNSGEVAGASQRHKHLQLIPPLGPGGLRAPVEALLSPPPAPGGVTRVAALGFAHAVTGLALRGSSAQEDAAQLSAAYRALREALGFGEEAPPYNLLATREWMLLVPRTRAAAHDVNVNAMGFAGSLLVRTPEQLAVVRRVGPLAVLREVAASTSG